MRYIDSHCHLADNFFYKKISQFIDEWKRNGISKLGAMATNLKTSKRIIELYELYPDIIVPSIGRHPWGAHKVSQSDLEELEKMISENRNAIIGEIGLDYYFIKDTEHHQKQKPLFNFFLEMAQKYNRSVMLHITGAERDIYDIISSFKLKANICCHWYSGSEKILKQLRDMGCYFTLNPCVIESKGHQRVLEHVELDYLLTESDGPVKFQGKVNSPDIIPILITQIATKLNINEHELMDKTHQNYIEYLQN